MTRREEQSFHSENVLGKAPPHREGKRAGNGSGERKEEQIQGQDSGLPSRQESGVDFTLCGGVSFHLPIPHIEKGRMIPCTPTKQDILTPA